MNRDLDKKLEILGEWAEEKERGVRLLVGGDFNARTGNEGGGLWGLWGLGEEEGFEQVRRSKDCNVNREGRKLCDFVEEQGWTIFNGNIRGDEEGDEE